MSIALQAFRESLRIGDPVEVIVRYGNRERTRQAKLVEVLRAAARVTFVDTGMTRMVHFRNIRLPDPVVAVRSAPPPPPKPAPPPPREQREERTLRPVPALPPARGSEPPPPPPAAASYASPSDLDVWVAMGGDLLTSMDAEIEELRGENEALDAEKTECDLKLDANIGRLKVLHERREAIAKLVHLSAQPTVGVAKQ